MWLQFDPPPLVDLIVGREVTDSFELIWPTGEVDEQFLGGPLSDMPQPGASRTDSQAIRPEDGQVSDDVVLAIQRTIATIGSDPAAIEPPPLSPRLPDRVTDAATAIAADDGRIAVPSGAEPTDDRRSALKRLISGLRRR